MPLFNPGGFANPMTTEGDIIVGGAGGVPTRLALGSDLDVLTAGALLPAWNAAAGGGQDPGWYAPDHGYLGWAYPPLLAEAPAEVFEGNGSPTYTAVRCVESGDVGHIVIGVPSGLTIPTATENYVGLYSATIVGGALTALTQLGVSASGVADAPFGLNNQTISVALAAPVAVVAGTIYYVAILSNGTGSFEIYQVANADSAGIKEASVYPNLLGSTASGVTTLPAGEVAAGLSAANYSQWCAIAV